MANYPKVTFDENTDYEEVELIVKSMYDCVLAQGDVCCKSKAVSDMLCEADVKRRAMSINKEFSNTDRYEANVKDLYNLLYNSAYCYDSNNPIAVPLKTANFDLTYLPYLEVLIDGAEAIAFPEDGVVEYYESYQVIPSAVLEGFVFATLKFTQDATTTYTDDFEFIVDSQHPFYNNDALIVISVNEASGYSYTVDAITGALNGLSCYVNGSSVNDFNNTDCPLNRTNQSLFIYNGDTLGVEIVQVSEGQIKTASLKANTVLYSLNPTEVLVAEAYRRYIFIPNVTSTTITEFQINS